MKKCTQALRYICDNLDAQIDSPKCREIRRHLEECPDCSAYLDSMKKTVNLYRQVSVAPVPKTVHRILHDSLKKEKVKADQKSSRPRA